ncbi:MFS transporter [Deinococcus radiophilus]|uniref:MFS transporter n=1 Tax=Deinococcus radiophilus TaxID=32062 RepID=A0A3S0KIZ6_9DEIO|nr:MFS transporter [Deinococcus radiophilus]RTR27793.1 MFS transporter [Deinococcus radiophilus]UFA50116.1 MFS transporter [Deinococcus radiophilus]
MLWNQPTLMLRLLTLLVVSEAAHFGFFVTALPLRADTLGLNAALIGTLMGGHYLADALSKGPMGYLAGRYGAGWLLLLASVSGLMVMLLAQGSLLGGGAPPYLALLGLAGLWGVMYGSLWPIVMGYSQTLARPERLSRALALTSLAVVPGLALGVGVLGPLMQRSEDLGINVLLGLQGSATLLALSVVGLRGTPQPPQTRASLSELLRQWRGVGLLLPAALAQTLAPGLLVTLLFPLLELLGLSMLELAFPALGLLIGLGLTLWLAGRMADRTCPRRALLPGLLLLALSYGVLALPHPETRLWAALPLLGVGYGAFLTGWNGLVGQVLPQGQRMTGWGTIMTVEALGYAIGPILGGLMWTAYGHTGVFATGAAVFVITLAYYLLTAPSQATQPRHKAPSL